MKQPDDKARLGHMLDAAKEAVDFLGTVTAEELTEDRKLGNSIVRSIEIIGEAAANITKQTMEQYPEIEWPVIIGMRNRIVHAYFDINFRIVWQTVKENLPPLIKKLENVLKDFGK